MVRLGHCLRLDNPNASEPDFIMTRISTYIRYGAHRPPEARHPPRVRPKIEPGSQLILALRARAATVPHFYRFLRTDTCALIADSCAATGRYPLALRLCRMVVFPGA